LGRPKKISFCEVDEDLDLLTLIWDQKEDCFHCPFLHRIGRDVPEKCTKTFEYLESIRPIMEHKRSTHGYKTTVRGSRGIKIVLREMPQMAPRVKRLRDYDRKRKRERQQKLVQENVKGFMTLSNPITAEYVNCKALLSVSSGRRCGNSAIYIDTVVHICE
jgi:hypothetical protein